MKLTYRTKPVAPLSEASLHETELRPVYPFAFTLAYGEIANPLFVRFVNADSEALNAILPEESNYPV